MRRKPTLALVALAVAGAALGGCGDGGDGAEPTARDRPTASDGLPAMVVARVGTRPIRRDELDRRVAALRSARGAGAPAATAAVRDRVLALMVRRESLEEELLRRGHRVSGQQVRLRWRHMSRAAGGAEPAAGRPLAAILLDVRLRVMLEDLHMTIRDSHPKLADVEVARFDRQLAGRWRKATVCRLGYEIRACGQVDAGGPRPEGDSGKNRANAHSPSSLTNRTR